jgi:hypothetical protein
LKRRRYYGRPVFAALCVGDIMFRTHGIMRQWVHVGCNAGKILTTTSRSVVIISCSYSYLSTPCIATTQLLSQFNLYPYIPVWSCPPPKQCRNSQFDSLRYSVKPEFVACSRGIYEAQRAEKIFSALRKC